MNAAIPSFPALAECTIANLSNQLALASLGEIEAYDNESSLLSIRMMCLAKCSLISR